PVKDNLDLFIVPVQSRIPSFIPDPNRPCTIFSLGNCSFKGTVCERMILNCHCKMFLSEGLRNSFGDCPALEHAITFQAQIIVKVACMMFMNNKIIPVFNLFCSSSWLFYHGKYPPSSFPNPCRSFSSDASVLLLGSAL